MRTVRRTAVLAAVLALQLGLVYGYSAFRTVWHYLLHSSLGFAAGLIVATALAALGRKSAPFAWAVAGQLLSVAPDVMFRMMRMAHVRWMDVFVAHITIHVAPGRLLVSGLSAVTASWAWWCVAVGGRWRTGLLLAVAAVGMVAISLALHTPVPTRLADYYTRFYGAG